MEEITEITYKLSEDKTEIQKVVLVSRVPKNRNIPKPHYRGIEVCKKTPIRIRGEQVEIFRTISTMRTLKTNVWTIKQNGKIISYANEIHLKDVEFALKG